MAQLELANFSSANGMTANAAATGTPDSAGRIGGPSLSFGRLLQAGASQDPATETTASGSATQRAANGAAPIAASSQASQLDVADPAALGKTGVGQQIQVAALAAGIAVLAGEGEAGEAKETASEVDASNSDTADGEISVEAMLWPGLPLFVEARAALRDIGSSGVEPSPSDVAAATDSIDSARLRFMLCSTTASGRLVDGGRSSLPTTDSSVGASADSTVSVSSNLSAASLDDSSTPMIASGQLVDGAREAARLVGDLESGLLADGNRSSTALLATGAVGGAPLPEMDSTVEMASGSTVSISLDGRTANLTEGARGPVTRPADFWSRFEPTAATGPATLAAAGVAAAAGIGAGTEPSMTPAAASNASTMTATIGDESVTTGWAGIIDDQQAARLASGRSFRWHPRFAGSLADPLARTGTELLASDRPVSAESAVSADEVRRTMASAAIGSVGDADRPLTPTDQDASSLAISAQARQRPVDSAIALATSLPEKSVRDAATIRVGEPTVPGNGDMLARSGSQPATLVRPDTGTSPASLPTAPEVLNFNQKNWERALGHQLNWMVNNRLQEAEIKVDPPNLGPIEVRVSLHHNQTSVTFFSHEAAVREAIESALPRLREMLDGQGISLNQAQVSDQSLARQQAGTGEQSPYDQRDGRSPTTTAQGPKAAEEAAESRPRSRSLLGMVDDYA